MYHFRLRFELPSLAAGGESSPAASRSTRRSLVASGGHPFARSSREQTGPVAGHSTFTTERSLGLRSTASDPELSSAIPSGRSHDVSVQGFRLLGMASREARMYLALVNGSRGAREAAQIAGFHRATGYRVLQRLVNRGLISGDGQKPQRYRSVEPSILFHRLELFYRDETEILGFISEAFHQSGPSTARTHLPYGVSLEPPRMLAPESRAAHPALLELARAKNSVGVIARPLLTPMAYRSALARTLGRLARSGVQVRLITDATPPDFRFFRAVLRETGGASVPLQLRHYSPLVSHLYSIDRQRVVCLPTLGVSSRAAPVGVVIEDLARVRPLTNRFEGLWAESVAASRELRQPPGSLPEVVRNGSSPVGNF